MAERFLIFESDRQGLRELRAELERATTRKTRIESVSSAAELRKLLRSGTDLDLLVASFAVDGSTLSGPKLTRLVRRFNKTVPIVLTGTRDDAQAASEAIRAGATEFLVCDDDIIARVETVLRKVRDLSALHRKHRDLFERNRELLQAEQARFQLVGSSPEFEELRRQILRVASIPRPVLIVGERGTGKELVARALHQGSQRAAGVFVAVNCAALTDTLLESELLGHERGAFSGAHTQRPGKFEQASDGTLFLDEISNMSLAAQQKILRVVEYGTLRRVGGTEEIRVDTRVVSATNSDLQAKMERGEFLRDLYDRLGFEVLQLPALRERSGDIAVLSQHFLDQFMREVPAFRGKRLTTAALRMLEAYSFPGNVRELKNIIERAVCCDTTNEISPEDIGLIAGEPEGVGTTTFKGRVAAFERKLIREALHAAGGNQARAARLLSMSYHQFRHYHQKHLGKT
jgi:DNA-binding NtrC family response regulator